MYDNIQKYTLIHFINLLLTWQLETKENLWPEANCEPAVCIY